jgi:phage/plasmid-associated DNA primase
MTSTIENLLKDVPFRHITVTRLPDGKKRTTSDKSNYTIEQIEKDKGNPNSNYKSYALKHSEVFCIDVDEKPMPKYLETLIDQYKIPYTITVGGYHLYIISDITTFQNSINIFNDFKGDMIHFKQNIWEPNKAIVYNGDIIPKICWEDFKQFCNIQKMNFPNGLVVPKKNKVFKDEDINNESYISKREPRRIIEDVKIPNECDNYEFINEPKIKNDKIIDECNQKILKIVTALINSLSVERATDWNTWIYVGMCLKNICNCDEFLSLWLSFSERCKNKYDAKICVDNWNSFKKTDKGYGLKSLRSWARQDNPKDNNKKEKKKKTEYVYNIITVLDSNETDASTYIFGMIKSTIIVSQSDFYIYDDIIKLWVKHTKSQFVRKISLFVTNEMKKAILTATDPNQLENWKESLSKYAKIKYIEGICKFIHADLSFIDLYEKLDSDKHVINFKNGIYNLKTSEFRERIREDYVSKCLSYDYTEESNEDISNEIKKIIFNISNDKETIYQFNLAWFGYCLTGETSLQKMLFVIGYIAENGKSTLGQLYKMSLPIYTFDFENKTFVEGNSTSHKQLINVQKPIRFCIVEELSKKSLNTSLLKKYVDGNELTVDVMYGTSTTIHIQSKLYITSNFDPAFVMDNGIKRRGLMIVLKNKFVEQSELDLHKDDKGYYLKRDLNNIFENDAYKLEFVKLLIPFAKQFYEKGFTVPKKIKENFEEVCNENDDMADFLDKYFIITKKNEDKIYKGDFTSLYNEEFKSKYQWKDIISDVKRHKLTYLRKIRTNGSQGSICGIKFK